MREARERATQVVVPVVAVVMAVGILVGYLDWRADTTVDDQRQRIATSAPSPRGNAAANGGQAPTVLVLGDSYATGPAGQGREWPEILAARGDWRLVEDADAGSGYVAAGDGRRFLPRASEQVRRLTPELVILAGGFHDVRLPDASTEEILTAADRVLDVVMDAHPGARVVLLSPFSAGEPGPRTSSLTAGLADLASDRGVTYIDATGFLMGGVSEGLIRDADLRPTRRGQLRLATLIGLELPR